MNCSCRLISPSRAAKRSTQSWYLPDFQYEYIEDTPARLFHQVNYGTGHIFRQCIGNSEIDFRRYDEIFYLTKREDAAETGAFACHEPPAVSVSLAGEAQGGLP